MLTGPAFNALLKTLEEPPPHVVFVLCTTDAQEDAPHRARPLPAVRLPAHQRGQIASRLCLRASAEGIEIDAEAMHCSREPREGSMRDAVG